MGGSTEARTPPACPTASIPQGASPAGLHSASTAHPLARGPPGRAHLTARPPPHAHTGVVVMMGSTYNGQFEPVERVDSVLEGLWQVGPPAGWSGRAPSVVPARPAGCKDWAWKQGGGRPGRKRCVLALGAGWYGWV